MIATQYGIDCEEMLSFGEDYLCAVGCKPELSPVSECDFGCLGPQEYRPYASESCTMLILGSSSTPGTSPAFFFFLMRSVSPA